MSDSKFTFNPFVGFRNVIDENIKERFASREETKNVSQVLLFILIAAGVYLINKMVRYGFTVGSMWIPLTIIAFLLYVVWRMHAAWVYDTIVEMASDSPDTSPDNLDTTSSSEESSKDTIEETNSEK